MQPLWIINLSDDSPSNKRIKTLTDDLCASEGLKIWLHTEVKAGIVSGTDDYRRIMDELVDQGRLFYNSLQQEGLVVTNMRVCVIGKAAEHTTRQLFQLLPGFLYAVYPEIVGTTANRGLMIKGFLYIPDNLNHSPEADRRNACIFLEELKMFMDMDDASYYSRIVLYQNIQHKNVRSYPQLNDVECADLLFQYLLNVFYLDNDDKGIFSEAKQRGFYSLGSASMYYDSEIHRRELAHALLENLLDELKNPDNFLQEDTDDILASLFNAKTIGADVILERMEENSKGLDINPKELEGTPDPNPKTDFLKAKLFVYYYLDYLRFMPARAVEFARAFAYMLTGRFFSNVAKSHNRLLEKFKELIDKLPERLYPENKRYMTIPQVKNLYSSLKTKLEKEKQSVVIKSRSEERTVFSVPDYLSTYYLDFKHRKKDALTPKEIAEQMRTALRSEPTVLSLLTRCFLLGTVLIFVTIPLLRFISPFIINLGNVAEHEWLWIGLVFILPFLYHFGIRLRRHFGLIRKLKYRLLAQSLVDAQEKASGRVYGKTLKLYEELIEYCDGKIAACDEFADSLVLPETEFKTKGIPSTLFNQSFIGGKFMGSKVVNTERLNDYILVRGSERLLPDMKKDDYISLLKEITGKSNILSLSVSALEAAVPPLLILQDDENLGRYINKLGYGDNAAVDLSPLLAMSEISGMLIDSLYMRRWHIRMGERIHLPAGYDADFSENAGSACKHIIFVTSWAHIRTIDPFALCGNTGPDVGAEIPHSVKMCCFYTQYQRGKTMFVFNGKNIELALRDMTDIENKLKELKLWNS